MLANRIFSPGGYWIGYADTDLGKWLMTHPVSTMFLTIRLAHSEKPSKIPFRIETLYETGGE